MTRRELLPALAIAVALAFVFLNRAAALAILAATVSAALAGNYFHRKIGGVTGDCLGAANQLVELALYLALAAQLQSAKD